MSIHAQQHQQTNKQTHSLFDYTCQGHLGKNIV